MAFLTRPRSNSAAQAAQSTSKPCSNPLKSIPFLGRSRRPSVSTASSSSSGSDVSEPYYGAPKRPRLYTITLPPSANSADGNDGARNKSRPHSPETARKRVRFGPVEDDGPAHGLGLMSAVDDQRRPRLPLSVIQNKPHLASRQRALSNPNPAKPPLPVKALSDTGVAVHPLLRAFAAQDAYTLHFNLSLPTGRLPPSPAFFASTQAFHPPLARLRLHFTPFSAPIEIALPEGTGQPGYTFAGLIKDLHHALRTPISHNSWQSATPDSRALATAAFNARVAADPSQRARGVRLVDYLGPDCLFRGVYWEDGKWCVRCVSSV